MKFEQIKALLDENLIQKSNLENLFSSPDPLQIARGHKEPEICLICALFAYGNAKAIVKFLSNLDFGILDLSENEIRAQIRALKPVYRFQNAQDIENIFITIKRLREFDIQSLIKSGFARNERMIDGVNSLIQKIYTLNDFRSAGYEFFFGKSFENAPKSPYKRYNMWLRWMVRDSDIDLGIFRELPKSALILPLDTHTHKVSQKLGICKRKSYDFAAAMEITENLRKFDAADPIKYDFAIYRLGQSGEI